MKKTVNELDYFTYSYDTTGQKKLLISNTLSAISLVGKKRGFYNDIQTQLTSIQHLGSNIHKLDDYCCASCENLRIVNIPPTISSFGDYSFIKCKNLNNFSVFSITPQPINGIGSHAFEDTSMSQINMDLRGKNYTYLSDYEGCVETNIDTGPYVGSWCFANNHQLTGFVFKTSNEISEHMFDGCEKLKTITFTTNTGSCVGSYAFANCGSLQTIEFPSHFEMLSKGMFQNCTNLKSVKLNNSVEEEYSFKFIQDDVFSNCTNLISIEIPESIDDVESISDNAFRQSSLLSIFLNGIDSETLKQYSGFNRTVVTDWNPETPIGTLKYGKWYNNFEYTINYANANGIPMVWVWCSNGCSLCKKAVKNVLSQYDCMKYVLKQPYLFVYSVTNLKSQWDILRKAGYTANSIPIPTYIKYWNVNGSIKILEYKIREIYTVNDFKNFIGTSFDSYTAKTENLNDNYEVVMKTKVFSGWGLTHDCDIFSSDNVKFVWKAAENNLSCTQSEDPEE